MQFLLCISPLNNHLIDELMGRSQADNDAVYKRENKQDYENNGKELNNIGETACNSAKTENCRNHSEKKESDYPIKHGVFNAFFSYFHESIHLGPPRHVKPDRFVI